MLSLEDEVLIYSKLMVPLASMATWNRSEMPNEMIMEMNVQTLRTSM